MDTEKLLGYLCLACFLLIGLMAIQLHDLNKENKDLRQMVENNYLVTMESISDYNHCKTELIKTREDL